MKRAAMALAALLMFGSLIVWGPATGAPSPSTDRVRYEEARTFAPPWEASCGPHDCGVPTIVELPVRTPSGVANVGLRAAGRTYTFNVEMNPRRADDNPAVRVEGRRLSLVVDMAEAGP